MRKWYMGITVALTVAFCVGCGKQETKRESNAPQNTLVDNKQILKMKEEAMALAKNGDPRAIPTLIGMIDADNSYDSVYGIGYFLLGQGELGNVTGVHYSSFHDGAWWRRWWAKNRTRFPQEVQDIPIPDFPKTEKGKKYVPFPEEMDTLDGKLSYICKEIEGGRLESFELRDLAGEIAREGNPRAIPILIGIIDADNSDKMIGSIGADGLCHFKLGELTGVRYRFYHDGAWWRRWWAKNRTRFPKEVQDIPIPDLPKTENGKKYEPFSEELDTLDGKLAYLRKQFESVPVRMQNLSAIAQELAETGDPCVIPTLIGVIDADNSYDTVYGVGYFGLGFDELGKVTGVRYSSYHDGAWWRRWWAKNRSRFSQEVQDIPIPDFPKTENGKQHIPFPEELDTLDGKLAYLREQFDKGQMGSLKLSDIAGEIAEFNDPCVIPLLIGIIDADNSYDTIYGVGYFGLGNGKLGELTGVHYSEFHDGAWWRRWWDSNKARFSVAAQNTPIPDLPKTENGKKHVPFPDDLDTFEGRANYLRKMICDGKLTNLDLSGIARSFAEAKDPRAIPLLIGVIAADNSYPSVYGLGYFGLGELTRVEYNASHDGTWWRNWWAENKKNYSAEVQAYEIPDFTEAIAKGRETLKTASKAETENELAEVPSTDIKIGNDKNKHYFLIGPKVGTEAPKEGYKVAIVMPGGDGGADFNPFVRRILKNALGTDWLIAEPVSVKWMSAQQIVWPTEINKVEGQVFSTEVFVESVIADVKGRFPINSKCIVTLSWSSSGPAAYAIGLQPETSVTGSYVAMSVFKPATLPALSNAKGRRFYIDHSPDDQVCPYADAQAARSELAKTGAIVKSSDYEGGHGWHGDVYKRIHDGLTWLTSE